ncbi:AMP-binding protein [Ensifer adhaerens]|uniref:AMP-binding protein n=1 Tax=Ensifer adhaerens TaxID=106592 RepID=UPI001CBC3C05|nr:AMP-binding protein [Ensifer adhaerens]MBZ7924655.1 AMP-binding protein [Ensifer adhaerens]UAX96114.1 AMP-binding protein [Ensifer adhaerens]UAY04544.1 AMP-binding protein [Ensifer adhaerens]UAY09976.1 AMP-binding protein [Ensifer adhaerens]
MIRIDDRLYDESYFSETSARLATEIGLTQRDIGRYAVCFSETVDWLSLFFAIRKAGASVLPIHPGTPYPAARKLAIGAGCDRFFYNSLTAEVLDGPAAEPEPGTLLQMSSGTTGAPKCVARSWAEIDVEIASYVRTFREPEDMTPVIACPTTHSYGLICGILVALKRGQTPVIVDTANPKYLLKVLRDTERPLLYSSPAILHTLARLLPAGERIHATMTSGTLLPDPWFADIRAKSRFMFQQYGCSESGCIAINPDVAAAGDMGFVLPHHSAETGSSAEGAAEIIVRNGDGIAIHTRDLGYRRTDGMLVFVSRMDDMINVSGLNVYPKDVEDAAMAMPAITDAVAFRKSDRFAGERVALLFSADQAIEPQAVREWCSRHLAGHQLPMEILQVDAVPRQANGKISRRDVAARHMAGEFNRSMAGAAS